MKKLILLTALLSVVTTPSFARIISTKGEYFVMAKGNKTPIFLVNKMLKEKNISDVKIYKNGAVHLISFSKNGEKSKLYSVDSKGFIYSIEPFSSYNVESVDDQGYVKFKEAPDRKYHISSKGFFFN